MIMILKNISIFLWIHTPYGTVEHQIQNVREYYFVLHFRILCGDLEWSLCLIHGKIFSWSQSLYIHMRWFARFGTISTV